MPASQVAPNTKRLVTSSTAAAAMPVSQFAPTEETRQPMNHAIKRALMSYKCHCIGWYFRYSAGEPQSKGSSVPVKDERNCGPSIKQITSWVAKSLPMPVCDAFEQQIMGYKKGIDLQEVQKADKSSFDIHASHVSAALLKAVFPSLSTHTITVYICIF
jgi:hypothetical protein